MVHPRYVQASEKQMEKLLPVVRFSRPATDAKMGVICTLRHGLCTALCSTQWWAWKTLHPIWKGRKGALTPGLVALSTIVPPPHSPAGLLDPLLASSLSCTYIIMKHNNKSQPTMVNHRTQQQISKQNGKLKTNKLEITWFRLCSMAYCCSGLCATLDQTLTATSKKFDFRTICRYHHYLIGVCPMSSHKYVATQF